VRCAGSALDARAPASRGRAAAAAVGVLPALIFCE